MTFHSMVGFVRRKTIIARSDEIKYRTRTPALFGIIAFFFFFLFFYHCNLMSYEMQGLW